MRTNKLHATVELTEDPEVEDALMENTTAGLPSFSLISMHTTTFRLGTCATRQPGHFGSSSRRALAGAKGRAFTETFLMEPRPRHQTPRVYMRPQFVIFVAAA